MISNHQIFLENIRSFYVLILVSEGSFVRSFVSSEASKLILFFLFVFHHYLNKKGIELFCYLGSFFLNIKMSARRAKIVELNNTEFK